MDDNMFKILFFIGVMVILILLIKYVVGDFSPISIDLVDEKEVEKTNKNGTVIGKTIVYTYKYTYTDNRIKYKTKTIKL